MATRLRVKRDVAGTGRREVRNDAVNGLDHQVHIDRRLDTVLAQGLTNQRPDRQIGHELIVHDIEVHDIGAGIEYGGDILAQASKIGGKNRRGD